MRASSSPRLGYEKVVQCDGSGLAGRSTCCWGQYCTTPYHWNELIQDEYDFCCHHASKILKFPEMKGSGYGFSTFCYSPHELLRWQLEQELDLHIPIFIVLAWSFSYQFQLKKKPNLLAFWNGTVHKRELRWTWQTACTFNFFLR